jgi:hypothetical protein
LSGDDQIWGLSLEPSQIGRRVKCPRCMQEGVIDDACLGAVIIRHVGLEWHVMTAKESAAIDWERCLR